MKKLHADDLLVSWREPQDRRPKRSREVWSVLRRRHLLEEVVKRDPVSRMSATSGVVDETALRDRVQTREHRRGPPIAARERRGRVGEHLLSEILRPIGIACLAAEVAVDLRMVSPEGQLGEAFHLLPLSLRDAEGNGLRRLLFH